MEDNQVTDLSYLHELAMGDESIIIETAETFLDDTPNTLVKIEGAHQNEDWEELYKQAHKIKPNLKYMGMEKASELIIDIERQAKARNPSDNLDEMLDEFKKLIRQGFKELDKKIEQLKK